VELEGTSSSNKGGAKMSEKCSFNTLRFIAQGRLNFLLHIKKEDLISTQKSKANQMVPSILPEN
jgi:hypothetical protein